MQGSNTDANLGAHQVSSLDRGEGGNEAQPDVAALKRFQKFVRIGLDNFKKVEKLIDRGDRLFRGVSKKDENDETQDKQQPTKVNKARRKIVASVTQIYSRNPKFIGKPKRPIMVPADPVPAPQVDPATGAPIIGPDGLPITTLQVPIDPETGAPQERDVSDKIAEVVAAIMDNVILESSFKAEAKACCLEAHHRPASIMQIGYEYDEDNQKDDVYFRWRSFKRFIIDPDAQIYNGVVRRCRFMGLRWDLRKSEAEGLGLKWSAMIDRSDTAQKGDEDDEVRSVYQIWSQEHGTVAWISDNGVGFARPPEPWPWKIDGYPFEILKLSEDTDKQFSRPLIVEAEGIQEEMDQMRETMQNKVVNNRTVVLYDPEMISEADITALAGRRQNGYKSVEGLSSRASPPMQVFNEDKLDAEFYNHYERNEGEMDQVLGTSANEQAMMTGKTAREVEEVSKNQGVMTSAKLDINADFMNRCARKAVQIAKQTYTEERVTKITTKDGSRFWVKWVGSDVLDEVDLQIDVGSIQKDDDEIRKQVALNMFTTLKDVPGISVKKLANDVLREHGHNESDEYWMDEQQGQVAPAPQPPTDGSQPMPADVRASMAGQVSPMV